MCARYKKRRLKLTQYAGPFVLIFLSQISKCLARLIGLPSDLIGADSAVLKAAAEALKIAVSEFPEVSAVEDSLSYDKEELVLELTPQGLYLRLDRTQFDRRGLLQLQRLTTRPECNWRREKSVSDMMWAQDSVRHTCRC
mgnify:CR=1 FL=1